MTAIERWTRDEFLERQFDLPEGGQWSELIEGEVVHLEPPGVDHGTIVLNLSKAFSEFAHATEVGYACFDLGLHLKSDPDTIHFPAACYFVEGPRFAEADHSVTDVVPALVVEIASTSDRVAQRLHRTTSYLRWGVGAVWTILPVTQTVAVAKLGGEVQSLGLSDSLDGESLLPDFQLPISKLFVEPDWWLGAPQSVS